MPDFQYTVIFERAEEGGYLAHVPALNGLTTEGDTLEQAKEMARDAIRCYLEALAKDHERFPIEAASEQISVALTE